eukprot:SAG25_NODE_897_length_4875_cov_2.036223_6_plen_55_part_00
MVFVDQPAGTGLAVATSDAGYANNQTDVGERFFTFLQCVRVVSCATCRRRPCSS